MCTFILGNGTLLETGLVHYRICARIYYRLSYKKNLQLLEGMSRRGKCIPVWPLDILVVCWMFSKCSVAVAGMITSMRMSAGNIMSYRKFNGLKCSFDNDAQLYLSYPSICHSTSLCRCLPSHPSSLPWSANTHVSICYIRNVFVWDGTTLIFTYDAISRMTTVLCTLTSVTKRDMFYTSRYDNNYHYALNYASA